MSTLRTSSYTISVKLEEEANKYMLIHGYTGAIDIVSEKIASYLNEDNDSQKKNMSLSDATINTLSSRGYLTLKTEQEEIDYVKKLANLLHRKSKILAKSFVFLVAYDCNFRCPYCYEKDVLKGSRQWTGRTFTKEMVDKAYETIEKIEPEPRLRPSSISLYGGEPLLHKNKEIIEYIVNKGKEFGYSFMAITNGYDLDYFTNVLGPNMINTLQITVDGIQETHNARRIHYKDKETFQKIIQNIGIALDCGVNISLRVNTDADNFNDLNKINQLFKGLGYFDKPGKLHPYSALLFDYTRKLDENPEKKRFNFLEQTEFDQLHKKENYSHSCHISNKAREIKTAIANKRRLNFSSTYCSAQNGSYIIDPFGDIYSCWNEVGNKEKIIGNYLNEEIEWTAYKQLWQSQDIGTSSLCSKCKYAFICHGGCFAHGEIRKGLLEPGFCNDFSETYKHAVNLAYCDIKNNINQQNKNLVSTNN